MSRLFKLSAGYIYIANLCFSQSKFQPQVLSDRLYLINGIFYKANFWKGLYFFLNLDKG